MKNIFNTNNVKIFPKWLLISVAIFLAIVILLGGLIVMYQGLYENKIYAGVKIGGLSLGGKTRSQARALLQARVDRLAHEGIDFVYKDDSFNLNGIVSTGSETGLAYEIWTFDIDKLLSGVYRIGRNGDWWQRVGRQINLMFKGKELPANYRLNRKDLVNSLKNKFAKYENPGKDAYLVFRDNKIEVAEEESGRVFDYAQAVKLVEDNLARIDNKKIRMKLKTDNPKVTKVESEFLISKAKQVLKRVPLALIFKQPEYYKGRKYFMRTKWWVNWNEAKDWLQIKYAEGTLNHPRPLRSFGEQTRVYLGVNKDKVKKYLTKVAEIVDTPAKDAKFEIHDGKVVEWQSSEDGFILNIEETIGALERRWIEEGENKVDLVLSVDKSKITNDNVNDLGIRELIGVGESDFSGSPKNRRHNIAVGAESLNGVLIKPDEEFSLIKALGEIDAEAGYLPELVIKEGRTVPEYGGGLCQIGTTLFRLVINSGLPVTQRRNHSYRVGYYEPAGTDATIYDPWPDFKFVNDTGHYILLQTRIEGDKVIFEFWGTNDGRTVKTTEPVIYNITAPDEPRIIISDELKPGEKKRVERAHNGADAYFNRTIVWPKALNRKKVEERFSSHYVPWRETWLVGKSTTTDVEVGL